MKLLSGWIIVLLLASPLPADTKNPVPGRTIAPPTSSNEFTFSLLPKSFSRNPRVDMTAFGEVTPAGHLAALPTSEKPIRCVTQSGGYRPDHRAVDGEKIPLAGTVDKQLLATLKSAGYIQAGEGQTPDIAIVYTWGSLYRSSANLVTRAAMVGGARYASQLEDVLRRDFDERLMTAGVPKLGNFDFEGFMPLRRYFREETDNESLYLQVQDDLYYIVVSAYDFSALARKQRVLLWRTHLTVNASGVSMADTLPALAASAAPFLGKETGRPGTLSKRVVRESRVEIGAAEVREYIDPSPVTAPKPKTNP